MKMTTIRIKNINSHEHSSFWLENYNTFIGENNSGKSNIFFAVRWFFGEIKLTSSNTFNGAGGESSVCITFHVDDEEIDLLGINKDAVESGFVSIEAYYEFDPDEAKAVSPKYRYISSDDSVINCRPKPEFISSKNVVYIPAIKKLDDELKFTNKSAINKLVSKYFIDHIRNDESCSCKYREIRDKINNLSELLKKKTVVLANH